MEVQTLARHLKRDRAIAVKKLTDPKIKLAPGSRRYWERRQKEYTTIHKYLNKFIQ